jgi:pimeloyl-ACP methyl ester carboxylesterase
MEDVIADVACPVLLIRATDDPFAAPHADELAAQLIGASSVQIVDVVGGMVPLPDQLPEEFAAAVSHFVDGLPR